MQVEEGVDLFVWERFAVEVLCEGVQLGDAARRKGPHDCAQVLQRLLKLLVVHPSSWLDYIATV